MKFTKEVKGDVSDDQVLLALKSGNDWVFRSIYGNYRDEFVNWAMKRYDLDNEMALDIFQESIAGLYSNALRGKLDNSNVNVKTFLFAVGKYHIFNQFNIQDNLEMMDDVTSTIEDMPEFVEEPFEKEENGENALAHLKQMGDPCKKILEAYYLQDKVLATIAEELGYKNKKVLKAIKHRCIEKLRTLLKF